MRLATTTAAVAVLAAAAARAWTISHVPHTFGGGGENEWKDHIGRPVAKFPTGTTPPGCEIIPTPFADSEWFDDPNNRDDEVFYVVVMTDPDHHSDESDVACVHCGNSCCTDSYDGTGILDQDGMAFGGTGNITFRNIAIMGDTTENWCVPKGFVRGGFREEAGINACDAMYDGWCQSRNAAGENADDAQGDCHYGHTALVTNYKPKSCKVSQATVFPFFLGMFSKEDPITTWSLTVSGPDAEVSAGKRPLKAFVMNAPAECQAWSDAKPDIEVVHHIKRCGNDKWFHGSFAATPDPKPNENAAVGAYCSGHKAGSTCHPTTDACATHGCVRPDGATQCSHTDLIFSADFDFEMTLGNRDAFACDQSGESTFQLKMQARAQAMMTPSAAGDAPATPLNMCCPSPDGGGNANPTPPTPVGPGTPPTPAVSPTGNPNDMVGAGSVAAAGPASSLNTLFAALVGTLLFTLALGA